ncbi:MAG TPA: ACP S-malonyltransferase [Firmicutes bacterium]|nr:ACP S-malonyltransferase [Bacillota bacterium]
MKLAFVFPGQGSQYVGMGVELCRDHEEAREVFRLANDVLGFPLSSICFHGPAEELVQNDIIQPAVVTASLAAWQVLRNQGIEAEAVAGLSVGEYAALVAAEALDMKSALKLVHTRGRIMRETLPPGVGGMLAVIGLERVQVEAACKEASEVGIAEPANYNCPGQIVVGGEMRALEAVESIAKRMGARKVVRVAMSSPSHCSLLNEAASRLSQELERTEIHDPRVSFYSSVDGRLLRRATEIRHNLSRQLCHPVMWEDVIYSMERDGVTHIVELGPGRTLSGFIKRTSKRIRVLNVEDAKSLRETLAVIAEAREEAS